MKDFAFEDKKIKKDRSAFEERNTTSDMMSRP